MSKQTEAMKLALNVLQGVWKGGFFYPSQQHISKGIDALRAALAEHQEPVVITTGMAVAFHRALTDAGRDAQEAPFETWWETQGQYLRAGGGQYEKTFAWHAWCAASSQPAQPKALTKSQREKIYQQWSIHNWTPEEVIQAIEAAHNNKENT